MFLAVTLVEKSRTREKKRQHDVHRTLVRESQEFPTINNKYFIADKHSYVVRALQFIKLQQNKKSD